MICKLNQSIDMARRPKAKTESKSSSGKKDKKDTVACTNAAIPVSSEETVLRKRIEASAEDEHDWEQEALKR